MSELRSELATALSNEYPGARWVTLTADASTRRFHRGFLASRGTCVVMDYGSSFRGATDDMRLSAIFEQARLPVARILRILPDAGALVLEDLGDETLEVAFSHPSSGGRGTRAELYTSAVRLAFAIATRGTEALLHSERAHGPALDEERFSFEMSYFLEHYVGTFLGRRSVSSETREGVLRLARVTAAHPRVLCHRDYHSRNIMVGPDGALSLVDIQDSRWGPDTYDLASLLRDAYVDLDEREVDELVALYWQLIPGTTDIDAMRARFDLVAAQRMIKALGTFGYQTAVLGRDRYRSAIRRTIERLSRLLPACGQTEKLASAFERDGIIDLQARRT
jgi:aminoglycoside/choline kinase family phosphotransferase